MYTHKDALILTSGLVQVASIAFNASQTILHFSHLRRRGFNSASNIFGMLDLSFLCIEKQTYIPGNVGVSSKEDDPKRC